LSSPRTASPWRWRSFDLLPLEFVLECIFLDRQFGTESGWIDEWVWSAGRDLRILFTHVVHRGMRSQRHVDMPAAQELETLLVLSDKLGIADQVGAGINTDASDDEYIVRATAIFRLHRPCCASRCVTG